MTRDRLLNSDHSARRPFAVANRKQNGRCTERSTGGRQRRKRRLTKKTQMVMSDDDGIIDSTCIRRVRELIIFSNLTGGQ